MLRFAIKARYAQVQSVHFCSEASHRSQFYGKEDDTEVSLKRNPITDGSQFYVGRHDACASHATN